LKEKELQAVTKHLNDLFSQLIKGVITKDEFNELSDELYKKQTILRYTIELEKGLSQRKIYNHLVISKRGGFL
jgi:polyhydroxyalkanoate synthesis regulator phasin